MAEQENIRYIVRVVGKDLDGKKTIEGSLRSIKGISHRMAKNIAIAFEKKTGIVYSKKIGEITEEQAKMLEDVILKLPEYNIPAWNFNRKRDYATGQDLHLVTNELEFAKRQDFQRLSEIKTYRGLRHGWGLTVRGQRTKSTHRGKGGVVGVMKKDAKESAKPAAQAGAEKTPQAKAPEKKQEKKK